MSHKVKNPVLLLTFNRPLVTEQVFEQIRKVKPSKLYISSDGPRNKSDIEKIKQVKKVVEKIDWSCKVRNLYQEKNLGCGNAVSQAIDWFFQHEEQGIILEDDVFPNESFFKFCDELLDRYKNEKKVMAVTGYSNRKNELIFRDSYSFTSYISSWGWATWKNAWEKFDHDLAGLKQVDLGFYINKMGGNQLAGKYWYNYFNNIVSNNEIYKTWASRWLFSVWYNDGLSCSSKYSLVKNIGFGKDSTHTTFSDGILGHETIKEIEFPLSHPQEIKVNEKLNTAISKNQFYIRWYVLLMKKIFKTIGLYQQFVMFASFVLTRYNRAKKLFTLGSKNH